ncbi:hypothetical protein NW762_008306 [Fusarium torreyae]|uniref:Uncharacterized protein n=1 Tax=Fusarium torreyae TaxID=1237075 RepID=A0A9W8RZ90_9HYPO|nr:hypothetical protein NW762_008306 [Fusarium torreyae]
MVRFSVSALAVIASVTLISATPVPQTPSVDAHPDLHLPPSPNDPDGGIQPHPAAVPAPKGPSPAPEAPAPAPEAPAPEAPTFEVPAFEPEHQDGTGTGADAPDANPFSASPGEGDKSTAETYVDALTSP